MQHQYTSPTIVILDSSDVYLDIMQHFLSVRGFHVVTEHLSKITSGEISAIPFLSKHNPQIILVDISIPYEDSWRAYEKIRRLEVCLGREFILTTPNLDELEARLGKKVGAFQLVDKDIDLQKIATVVQDTWVRKAVADIYSDPQHTVTTG